MVDKETLREMLSMKISNWESIEYSEGINCPNPECDNKGHYDDSRNILGWCDTPYGYMFVCECKKCFTKYRFHGTTGNKFDFDKFAFTFMLNIKKKE